MSNLLEDYLIPFVEMHRTVAAAVGPLDDKCPEGGDHEPETITEIDTTEHFGNVQTHRFDLTTCAKCGEPCEPRSDPSED